MGLATLLGRSRGPTIGGIQIDVSVRETHRASNEVTDHAIELGSDISDHVRRMPDEVSMEGVVSDAPTNLADLVALQISGDDTQKRYLELLGLVDNAETFELVTGLRTYTDMVFARFEVTRDRSTGEIIQFSADMKQIQFATSEEAGIVVSSEADAPKTASKADVGPKKPPPAPPAVKEPLTSSFRKVLGFAGF